MEGKNGLLIKALFAGCILFSCNDGTHSTASNNKDSLTITAGTGVNGENNILSYLSGSKDHSIFIELVKKAGLDETLNKPGPFTVFAITNKGFEKLPAGRIEKWKKENNQELLNFLGDHIVAGALAMNDLEKINKLTTLNGDQVMVSIRNNKLMVNHKLISGGSFSFTNGVVYITDQPLMPPK